MIFLIRFSLCINVLVLLPAPRLRNRNVLGLWNAYPWRITLMPRASHGIAFVNFVVRIIYHVGLRDSLSVVRSVQCTRADRPCVDASPLMDSSVPINAQPSRIALDRCLSFLDQDVLRIRHAVDSFTRRRQELSQVLAGIQFPFPNEGLLNPEYMNFLFRPFLLLMNHRHIRQFRICLLQSRTPPWLFRTRS